MGSTGWRLGAVFSLLTLAWPLAALAAPVKCEIKENGESAFGTFSILKGEQEVASGECGRDTLKVPAGKYTAVVKLDGTLDGPVQRKPLSVGKGAASVSADFETGTLSVRIERAGRRAAGVAIVRRDGKQIGTLGSGVAAHLSVGTYEVVVRYRNEEKAFAEVKITAGATRELSAKF